MVKRFLYSVLQQQSLDEESLHTTLSEVEAILNDYPITKVSDNVNDLTVLILYLITSFYSQENP